MNQTQQKKINLFGVFGVIFFNLIVGLAVSIILLALLFSLWMITLIFTFSPVLFVIVILTKLQAFTWFTFITSLLLCALGILLYPLAHKITQQLSNIAKKYLRYNQQMMYH